jgi:ribokinase
MRALARLGCPAVLLTDGIGGAYLGAADQLRHCPALVVTVAGTAGAGDALASTFAGWRTLGHDFDDCLRAATLNAASVVTHVDTQTGLLTRDRLTARIAETATQLAIRSWPLG